MGLSNSTPTIAIPTTQKVEYKEVISIDLSSASEEKETKEEREEKEEKKEKKKRRVRFVVLSDTHNMHTRIQVPEGDVLLHCGDFTKHRQSAQIVGGFNDWLKTLPHKHKFVIAGNHEMCLDPEQLERSKSLLSAAKFLQNELVEVEGVRLYGAPWTPARSIYYRAKAFAKDEASIEKEWSKIPENVHILATHCPPYGIGDLTLKNKRVGCVKLREKIYKHPPRVHCFGHNHDEPGPRALTEPSAFPTTFINVATANTLRPHVVDFYLDE